MLNLAHARPNPSAVVTIGVALAVGVNQALRSAIEGLDWVPWWTMLSLTLLMAVVTAVAAAAPALRATRVDPIRSLRG